MGNPGVETFFTVVLCDCGTVLSGEEVRASARLEG